MNKTQMSTGIAKEARYNYDLLKPSNKHHNGANRRKKKNKAGKR